MTSRPSVSSPLACSATYNAAMPSRATRGAASRAMPLHFPTSRPLRPFPSIANTSSAQQKKPTKIIVPPKDFKSEFVLNLTQAELSRQD